MTTRKILSDYFQCDISEFGFQDLYDLVISKNNCVLCGTCMSICPRIGMTKNQPSLLDYDPECSLCFKYCAKTYFPEKFFEKEIFNIQIPKIPLIGYYQKTTVAKSTDDTILKQTQNGGIVTTLLIHALNNKLIDGVLLTGRDENWIPKPIIARTPKEILDATGSIYALSPSLITYKDAVYKYKLKRLAFVGMPCQIRAVRKLQFFPPLSDKFGKFILIIGLFCTSNYSYDSMKEIIQNEIKVPITKVKKLDIAQGKFIVYTKDGLVKEIPLKKVKKYNWPSCQFCKDYTAEFSDISVGSVGAPENGWNSVIIRSDVGRKIFNDTLASKKIKVDDQIDLEKIKNDSLRKKSKVIQIDEKILPAMRLFNVSKLEGKTFTTLLSLEHADLSMLSAVMNREQHEIVNALEMLQKRNWIFSTNEFYKPYNPVKIFKEEIYQLKKKLYNDIDNFKSEALKELKTIYFQNNLKDVKDMEFIDILF